MECCTVPYDMVSMEMHLLCVASKPSLEFTAVESLNEDRRQIQERSSYSSNNKQF